METKNVIFEQRRMLVQEQIHKIGTKVLKGEVSLPLDDGAVLAHVDTNFSFYFGTMTRRWHHEGHGLSEPLSGDKVAGDYMSAVHHIGFMINRAMEHTVELGDVVQIPPHWSETREHQIAA
jgi:hypothetical protein